MRKINKLPLLSKYKGRFLFKNIYKHYSIETFLVKWISNFI